MIGISINGVFAQTPSKEIPADYGYIVKIGQQVPDFSMTTADGKTVRMADLKGKIVMLQFTASWCSVCRKEMPHIESLTHPSPRCNTCVYVMPSETSPTGLRCGHQYFLASPMLRKFTRMDHYPSVKTFNACESWADKAAEEAASD